MYNSCLYLSLSSLISIKDDFGKKKRKLIDFFYIYIYCRKCNAEFNKLIKCYVTMLVFFGKK